MKLGGRWMILGSLAGLAACASGGGYVDPGEPLRLEDYEPLPPSVTPDNAPLIVHRALQTHRRSNADPETDFSYAFSRSGFVQISHSHPPDREQERTRRFYVAYLNLTSVQAVPRFNFARLREEFCVVLQGRIETWESPVRPFRALPDLGSEPSRAVVESLEIPFDEAQVAHRLSEAFLLLSRR
jgi:hypothetical protein